MEQALQDRIRERAYFLSQSGSGAGDGIHFWLIAEREVLAEVATETAATSQPAEAIRSVETVEPTAELQASETAQHPTAEQPTKAVPKPRAKGSPKRSSRRPHQSDRE